MEPIILSMRDFTKLKVWERSNQLTLAVYRATAAFPREETYGLKSQTRRSCASIPANIAEGCGRGTNADLARFLQIALGSASELHVPSSSRSRTLLTRPSRFRAPERVGHADKAHAHILRREPQSLRQR